MNGLDAEIVFSQLRNVTTTVICGASGALALPELIANGDLIVADVAGSGRITLSNGRHLTRGHYYTVKRFDSSGNLELYNPWGYTTDNTIEPEIVPAADIASAITNFVYQAP
jgi:hypothetical protein